MPINPNSIKNVDVEFHNFLCQYIDSQLETSTIKEGRVEVLIEWDKIPKRYLSDYIKEKLIKSYTSAGWSEMRFFGNALGVKVTLLVP